VIDSNYIFLVGLDMPPNHPNNYHMKSDRPKFPRRYRSQSSESPTDSGGSGGHFDRSDAALLCRSVRWQITDEDRGKIKRKLIDALETATRPRDIASLSKALIACEAQNQRDDLLLAKQDSGNPEEQELKIIVEHVEMDRISHE